MKISLGLFRLFIYRANQPSQSSAERRGGANGRLSRRDLEPRILDVLRGTEARSSALPHTPTCRELFCRRIVGPVMVRIGFESFELNDALEERVFPIAFLGLMDGLEPIHSQRERRER